MEIFAGGTEGEAEAEVGMAVSAEPKPMDCCHVKKKKQSELRAKIL